MIANAIATYLARLTAVEDGVSRSVRQQYEENPYPRWNKASPVVQTTIEAHLRHLFPLVDVQNVVGTKGAEILIAGCGTGQHSIETARQFPGSRVLAIDFRSGRGPNRRRRSFES